ncbi:MAG: hypothetical protein KC561_01200 [Myxococcales bacterium]|nr:hypothetical protein [Myxococcales bacterium]
MNIQRAQLDLSFAEIARVAPRLTYFIIPNGLLLETHEGGQYKFVVAKRNQVLALIESRI